ncbi:YpmS family protein [Bacillus sp. FJAT-22090]|uniref:YpmS family protein n=1 Tax=Bacillus sp. FJAT-22090 TaxID=1581038 RepID=UPI0011A2ECE1|nr:YpmS family protein [Bacillus sp. FJAT-22090]
MNKWKIAFFLLVLVIFGSIGAVVYWITSPIEPTQQEIPIPHIEGHVLTVNATKEDFQGIANTYLQKEMKGKPLPIQLTVDDQIILSSELTIFSLNFPIKMYFEPFVEEGGNIRLEQSSLEIGQAKLQPEAVLKLLQDSIDLPEWIVVKPAEKQVLIQLASIPMSSGVHVRAKQLDLEKDIITLEIVIPSK